MQGSAVISRSSSSSIDSTYDATTAIYASRILTPQEEISDGVIVVEGGRITGVGHRDEIRIPSGATTMSRRA